MRRRWAFGGVGVGLAVVGATAAGLWWGDPTLAPALTGWQRVTWAVRAAHVALVVPATWVQAWRVGAPVAWPPGALRQQTYEPPRGRGVLQWSLMPWPMARTLATTGGVRVTTRWAGRAWCIESQGFVIGVGVEWQASCPIGGNWALNVYVQGPPALVRQITPTLVVTP